MDKQKSDPLSLYNLRKAKMQEMKSFNLMANFSNKLLIAFIIVSSASTELCDTISIPLLITKFRRVEMFMAQLNWPLIKEEQFISAIVSEKWNISSGCSSNLNLYINGAINNNAISTKSKLDH